MAIFVEYANVADQSLVNYHVDASSMTVLPTTDQRIVDFVSGGGTIGAYITPPSGPTPPQIDQAQLNAILSSPGSVVRGLALIVLDIANGAIPIKTGAPLYTTTQLINLIVAKMR